MKTVAARIVGVALAVVCFELVIRQIYSLSSAIEPGYGVINAPGRSLTWRREGSAVSHWTAHGVRGTEPIDPATHPILALGDSYTEGVQVEDDEAYPALTEVGLRGRGVMIPVANAGRSSASAADYIAFAPRHRDLFSPRWTVIQMRDDDLEADAWEPSKTHFAKVADTLEVVTVLPPPRGRLGTLFWDWRQQVMLVGYGFVRIGEFTRATETEPPLFRAGSHRDVTKKAAFEYPIESELDRLFAAYDSRLTVLYLPAFDPKTGFAATPTEARLLAHCARRGFSCVSIRDAYAGLWALGQSPFGHPNSTWNVGHMNAVGHRVAAERLTAELLHLNYDGLL